MTHFCFSRDTVLGESGERLLATCASQHLAFVYRRLDRGLSFQLHILSRSLGVIELALAQRLGAWAARFHFAMAHRLPFGACVVLGPITAMTLSLSFPFQLLSVSRDVPSSACSRLDDSGIVERGELSRAEPGKLPREALLSIDALPGGAAQPARPSSTTPSSRRNLRTSGYTRHRFTGFASLLCRSIRPRPVVDPTSIQFAAR